MFMLEVYRQVKCIQQVIAMTSVPLPENYGSIDALSKWLQQHLPHEFHVDGDVRWKIISGYYEWHIVFVCDHDATLFNLKWPR